MFKNWAEICKIKDANLKWFIAGVQPGDRYYERATTSFPEFFTYEEQHGPYPLSWIREEAEKYAREEGSTGRGYDSPCTFSGVPEEVPVQVFDIYGNDRTASRLAKLPEGIDPDSEQGQVVTWNEKPFVVLERNESCQELYIAPAELISVDC